jgi:hypothetical protein
MPTSLRSGPEDHRDITRELEDLFPEFVMIQFLVHMLMIIPVILNGIT